MLRTTLQKTGRISILKTPALQGSKRSLGSGHHLRTTPSPTPQAVREIRGQIQRLIISRDSFSQHGDRILASGKTSTPGSLKTAVAGVQNEQGKPRKKTIAGVQNGAGVNPNEQTTSSAKRRQTSKKKTAGAGDGIKRKRGVRLPRKQKKTILIPGESSPVPVGTEDRWGQVPGEEKGTGNKKNPGGKGSGKQKSAGKEPSFKSVSPEREAPSTSGSGPSNGPLFSAVSKFPLLTPEQEKELGRRIQKDGDEEAFNLFVMSNLRLAMACVRDIMRRMGGNTILDFTDLSQEAVLGLMTAVRRFDPDRGVRFSTYGLYWIYQRVKRAIVSQRRGMTVPGFAGESVFAMTEYIELYNQGKEEEIPKRFRNRVKDLARITNRVMSFGEADVDEGTGMQRSGTVDESRFMDPDRNSSNHFLGDETMSRFFKSDFHALLDQELSPYEADILRRKFGLSPYSVPANYKEIGEAHNRSGETIRLSMEAALKKLKKNKRAEEFMEAWLKRE